MGAPDELRRARRLKIAEEIVTITYAALLGMLALAGALAFGLGGRDVAAQMLQGAYDAGQRNKDQIKQDMRQGRERGREQAEQAEAAAQGDNGGNGRPAYPDTAWANY